MLWRRRPCACTRVSRLPTGAAEAEEAAAGMVFVLKTIDGEPSAGAEEAGAEETGADEAGAEEAGAEEAPAGTVTVAKTVDAGAVTVTVGPAPTGPGALEVGAGAALDCSDALEEGEAEAVLVASLLAGLSEFSAGLPPTR